MKVTLHHLAPDAAQTDASPRDQSLGELTPDQLGALLERFRGLDPVKNHELDPHLEVQTTARRFIVRLSARKFYLYDARDSSQAATELEVPGLLAVFAGQPAPAGLEPAETPRELPPSVPVKRKLGPVLLVAGLGLNAWAAYVFLRPAPTEPLPVSAPVTDAGDLARLRDPLFGTYATGPGTNPGDRLIVLGPGDTVQLQVLEANHAVRSEVVTGILVRQQGRLAIAVPGAGFIAPQPDGSLLYFGDTYHHAPK
jgi:hypothetical protein